MRRKLKRAIALIMALSMMVLPVSAAEVTTDPVEAAEVTAETLVEDVIQADAEATIELPYVDVNENDWFFVETAVMYETGLMTGLDSTHFGPYDSLARAQFAMIIWRICDDPDVPYFDIFPDVPDGTWYTKAVLFSYALGVINGYSNTGCFGPNDKINREQMATMMYRLAESVDWDVSAKEDLSGFVDGNQVNGFAQEAMSWAVAREIITGKDNGVRLDPQGNASRAEAAVILTRFFLSYADEIDQNE